MILIQNLTIEKVIEKNLDGDNFKIIAEDKKNKISFVWYLNSKYQKSPSIIRKTQQYQVVSWPLYSQ